jgi:hypothetical protein
MQRYRDNLKEDEEKLKISNIIFDAIVGAGVTQKLISPVMEDMYGNEMINSEKNVGHPTSYKILWRDMIFFRDKRGCNNNQALGVHAVGQLLALPSGNFSTRILGMVTELHLQSFVSKAGTE